MTEPVTLADIKTHLRIDAGVTDENDFLNAMILAARRACEGQINQSVVGADLTLTLDAFPVRYGTFPPIMPIETGDPAMLDIELSGGTVIAITSFTYFDQDGVEQPVDPAAYVTDFTRQPARIGPVKRWPTLADPWPMGARRPGAVRIAYSVSPLAPDDLAVVGQAMRLLIGGWYRNREAVQVDARGIPAEIPLTVTWLLGPLRKWAIS